MNDTTPPEGVVSAASDAEAIVIVRVNLGDDLRSGTA
jgi:hypothetical protein